MINKNWHLFIFPMKISKFEGYFLILQSMENKLFWCQWFGVRNMSSDLSGQQSSGKSGVRGGGSWDCTDFWKSSRKWKQDMYLWGGKGKGHFLASRHRGHCPLHWENERFCSSTVTAQTNDIGHAESPLQFGIYC